MITATHSHTQPLNRTTVLLTFAQSEVHNLPPETWSIFNPDVSKVPLPLQMNSSMSRPAGDGRQSSCDSLRLHLLIEFPLWCNCIAGCSDYRRERTQVTALHRVPLSFAAWGGLYQRLRRGRELTRCAQKLSWAPLNRDTLSEAVHTFKHRNKRNMFTHGTAWTSNSREDMQIISPETDTQKLFFSLEMLLVTVKEDKKTETSILDLSTVEWSVEWRTPDIHR